MHSRSLRVPALLAAVVGVAVISSSLTRADDAPAGPTTAPAREPGRGPAARGSSNDHEILEASMETMEKALKAIDAQVDDAAKDESTLKHLAAFQTATIRSKGVLPGTITRIADEAQRTEATKQYRQMMVQVLVTAAEVEEHVLSGDRAAAKESLKELHSLEKSGHDDFRPKKGKR